MGENAIHRRERRGRGEEKLLKDRWSGSISGTPMGCSLSNTKKHWGFSAISAISAVNSHDFRIYRRARGGGKQLEYRDAMDCGSFGKEKHSIFSEGGNAYILELLLGKWVDVRAGDGVGNAAVMSDAGSGYEMSRSGGIGKIPNDKK
jgi:hypothetical protein